MSLTQREYQILWDKHVDERNRIFLDSKIQNMALYLDNTEIILTYVNSLSNEQLSDEQLFLESLAPLDAELEAQNVPTSTLISSIGFGISALAYNQTREFGSLLTIPFEFLFSNLSLQGIVEEAFIPRINRAGTVYRLSEAIWGIEKRDAIYEFILQSVRQKDKRQTIVNKLEQYVQNRNQGGNAYFRAERVFDTEHSRFYDTALRRSITDFNRQKPGGVSNLLYRRELSPVHIVKDICDTVAGTYDVENDIPRVPSHPLCKCLIRRVFADDYKGEVKKLSSRAGFFYDPEYRQYQEMV